jgi:hypothetical protein
VLDLKNRYRERVAVKEFLLLDLSRVHFSIGSLEILTCLIQVSLQLFRMLDYPVSLVFNTGNCVLYYVPVRRQKSRFHVIFLKIICILWCG